MPNRFVSVATAGVLALGALALPARAQPYDEDDGPRDYTYDGCRSDEAVGTGAGAIIGGVIGNQFGRGGGRTAATIGGVILGGIAGNAIARDACRDRRADAYYYNGVYSDAFEEPYYNRVYSWRNPYNGHYGTIRPIREYYDDDYGGPCREFQQVIYVDGHRAEATGVACRERDGSWRIVNS